jgi:MFS family permease
MAICCVLMATISTYAEIGIIASIVVISCRALQGFSSMGEKVGAQLYLAETFKSPFRYIYGNIISIQSELGGVFALIVASASLYLSMNWRDSFLDWSVYRYCRAGCKNQTKRNS